MSRVSAAVLLLALAVAPATMNIQVQASEDASASNGLQPRDIRDGEVFSDRRCFRESRSGRTDSLRDLAKSKHQTSTSFDREASHNPLPTPWGRGVLCRSMEERSRQVDGGVRGPS